jgi:hypothetical protein
VLCRYDFFLQSPVLAGQMRYECEFDWGGTRIFVSTAIVEGLRCFFIEPRNGFFQTPTVYGRYDDEVSGDVWLCFVVFCYWLAEYYDCCACIKPRNGFFQTPTCTVFTVQSMAATMTR